MMDYAVFALILPVFVALRPVSTFHPARYPCCVVFGVED